MLADGRRGGRGMKIPMGVRTNGHEEVCGAGWVNALSLEAGAETHGNIHRHREEWSLWTEQGGWAGEVQGTETFTSVANFLRTVCCPHSLIQAKQWGNTDSPPAADPSRGCRCSSGRGSFRTLQESQVLPRCSAIPLHLQGAPRHTPSRGVSPTRQSLK